MRDNNRATAFVDTNDKTIKSIRSTVANSKAIEPAYLFTMSVKDHTVHRAIPVAYMICGSESRYIDFLAISQGFPCQLTYTKLPILVVTLSRSG